MYRLDFEWDEYLGGGEYETKQYYEYVLGDRMLGRAIRNALTYWDDMRLVAVNKLCFSFKAIRICMLHSKSSRKNLTS